MAIREQVRFLLGDQPRQLGPLDPTMTVLDYLRLIERRIGTKEGCNEGDCGACTVVLGRIEQGRLRYQAVNACIQLVGMLDGCQLLTVEDLAGPDGSLHPVQAAMVAQHASQCGFCTPGFVMSLFALYQAGTTQDAVRIDEALAGNLCRCTGYAPIVAAAQAMRTPGAEPDRFQAAEAETMTRLAALADDATLCLHGDGRRFLAPASLGALAELLLAEPAACLVAGATDVGLWITKQLRQPDPVIWLGRVAELKQLAETGAELSIGATVTYTDALEQLEALAPDLGVLLRRLGGEQVRNAGTIGGNIANGSPIGDSPPALIALGARLVLRQGQERRELPLEEYFLAYGKQDRRPGEFVERIRLPKPAPDLAFRAYKVAKRFDQDITAVLGAFALRVVDGQVAEVCLAYGGMAATPKRARRAEAALLGQPWGEATVAAAIAALPEDFAPITDMRASAAYRMQVAGNLLRRLHLETTDPAALTRLVPARSAAHG